MKKVSEYLVLWTLGGTIYYTFEVIFRGFSHWSMFMLGGLCLVFFGQQGLWVEWEAPLWLQLVRCVLFVTAGEFITGIIVNKWLALERLGLFGSAFSTVRTDMCALYDPIFRTKRVRDLSGGIPALLAVWRGKTAFSRTVIFHKHMPAH